MKHKLGREFQNIFLKIVHYFQQTMSYKKIKCCVIKNNTMFFVFIILEGEFCFKINCTEWLPDQGFYFWKTTCSRSGWKGLRAT